MTGPIRKSAGGTNNFNDATITCKCPRKCEQGVIAACSLTSAVTSQISEPATRRQLQIFIMLLYIFSLCLITFLLCSPRGLEGKPFVPLWWSQLVLCVSRWSAVTQSRVGWDGAESRPGCFLLSSSSFFSVINELISSLHRNSPSCLSVFFLCSNQSDFSTLIVLFLSCK